MKKKAAEIIINMATEHGNVLFEEPLFCELYEKSNKYINYLLDKRIKNKRKKCPCKLSEEEVDNLINDILKE